MVFGHITLRAGRQAVGLLVMLLVGLGDAGISEAMEAPISPEEPAIKSAEDHLVKAVNHRDIKKARQLLAEGADINGKAWFGDTSLGMALRGQRLKMMRFLLSQGADPEIETGFESPELPLVLAIRTQWLDGIRLLIEHGVKVNAKDKEGRAPFYYAFKSLKVMKLLLELGANPFARGPQGSTYLHRAYKIKPEGIDLLIRKGLDVNARNERGQTPLHLLMRWDRVDRARQLLARGARVHIQDNWGRTPMHYAVESYETKDIQLLINKGADINARDIFGRTPLYLVCQQPPKRVKHSGRKNFWDDGSESKESCIKSNKPRLDFLKSRGAKSHGPDPLAADYREYPFFYKFSGEMDRHCFIPQNLSAKTPAHMKRIKISSLHLAAEAGDLNKAKLLIQKGVSVNARDVYQKTPLHYASENDRTAMVQLLLKSGAQLNALDEFHRSPLHVSVKRCYAATVKLLLKRGAEVDVKDYQGNSALHFATDKRHSKIIRLLFFHGADIQIKNDEKETPILNVMRWGDFEVFKLFMSKVSQKMLNGELQSIIGWTIGAERKKHFKYLLDKGADIHAWRNAKKSGETGESPIHSAARHGELFSVQLLVDHGADVNAHADSGTPLSLAVQYAHEDVIRYLVKKGAQVYYKSPMKSNALHWIAWNGKSFPHNYHVVLGWQFEDPKPMADLFLKQGASVHGLDWFRSTPLHLATKNFSNELAEWLLEHGAKVYARDKDGNTPLHYAVDDLEILENKDPVGMVKLLMKHGANPQIRNKKGRSPMSEVKYECDRYGQNPGHPCSEIIDILKQYDPTRKSFR